MTLHNKKVLITIIQTILQSNFTQAALANSSLPAKAVKFQVLLRTRGTNGKLVPFEVTETAMHTYILTYIHTH